MGEENNVCGPSFLATTLLKHARTDVRLSSGELAVLKSK
jgi:hypothetical protein